MVRTKIEKTSFLVGLLPVYLTYFGLDNLKKENV